MDVAAADAVAPAGLIVNSNVARIDDSMVFDFILKVVLWLLGTVVVLFVLDD